MVMSGRKKFTNSLMFHI
uniref:Uncharacterized protein n=1 Tax=Rhizophora mucronata TaxID=61149 RepID=A0A2P2PI35_RHIMU